MQDSQQQIVRHDEDDDAADQCADNAEQSLVADRIIQPLRRRPVHR
jgi:hypothetical protein